MKDYFSKTEYTSEENSIIDTISIPESFSENTWIHIGGWQSWNPGFEIAPNTKQPPLHSSFFKMWNPYIEFPGTKSRASKNIVLAQFFTYLRCDNDYFVLVSCGNLFEQLPPVQFIINRKEKNIKIELCDINKSWKKDELQAKIEIFTASSYFEVQDKLKSIFGSSISSDEKYSERFNQLKFLGNRIYGWESWYNHYQKINEDLILNDLEAIQKTDNLISLCENYCENQNNVIFQIDDGWEKQLGTWEIDEKLFPNGLKSITQKIEAQNFIPGLWIAPFIVDLRSKSANEHPEWLLRDRKGHLVKAGFNPRWGSNGYFYCFDLSRLDVIEYLDNLLETIINEWGFRYIKLDFLYAGMHNGAHYDKNPAYISFTNALKILTKRKKNADGKDIAYLGCGTPFELSFTTLPLSRIGCDTYEHWKNKLLRFIKWNGRNEAYLNLKDSIGHALWNKIIFVNDPDVIFIRDKNCTLTDDEKKLIAFIAVISGNQIMYSDDPANCSSNHENELTKEIITIINKYSNIDFGVQNISKDTYKIFSRNCEFEGIIELGEKHQYKIN